MYYTRNYANDKLGLPMLTIEQQIEAYADKIPLIQKRFTVGNIVPYPYQAVAYIETAKRIAKYEHPFTLRLRFPPGKPS